MVPRFNTEVRQSYPLCAFKVGVPAAQAFARLRRFSMSGKKAVSSPMAGKNEQMW